MANYTFDTDFSSLDGPQSGEWMSELMHNIDEAFPKDNTHLRVLGNLLVLERFINTIRQGLAEDGQQISLGLERSRDLLWDYVKGRTTPDEFQDFANDYYACSYAYNVGNIAVDAPREFVAKYFMERHPENYELIAIEWSSLLLMELVAMAGGHLDFDELEDCREVDFYGIDEMLNVLEDACTELTDTPYRSNAAGDMERAMEQVRQTPLFRDIVRRIQTDIKTALTTTPSQLDALQKEYSQHTILAPQYAKALLEY